MDINEIDELMTKMEEKGVSRLVIKEEGFELELERGHASHVHHPPLLPPHPVHTQVPAEVVPAASMKKEGQMISSPIVGTFYAAASPDDPPFVKVGDIVEPENIVCIVEAMKVMNEVKAGVGGKVVEILVKNGDPVEFGTDIFRVE